MKYSVVVSSLHVSNNILTQNPLCYNKTLIYYNLSVFFFFLSIILSSIKENIHLIWLLVTLLNIHFGLF